GYSGFLLEMIRATGAEIGDEVVVERPGGPRFRGLLMSKSELSAENIVVIKLSNGYNIGVSVDPSCRIERVAPGKKPAFTRPQPPPMRGDLPRVKIIGTGGTIASRVDYRTGAVRPAISSDDLVSLVPELSELAVIDAEVLFSMYSEDFTVREWEAAAERVRRVIEEGYGGVVLTHGTDTMHYTSAALSFALQRPPVPVVLVGSQRSSDRPSSDAALNLMGAVWVAAQAPFAEVVVTMHAWHSDDALAIHRGTRVVKMHTSSRDAFKSVNSPPLALLSNNSLKILDNEYHQRGGEDLVYAPGFSDRAALIKFYPGMSPDILEHLASQGVRGVVLEGTGLGHVARRWIPVIRRLTDGGFFVGMTSQCRFGRVNMRVYNTGRDLLNAGVVELSDMLSEVALVKLMWALHRATDLTELARIMLTPIAHEIGGRILPQGAERP
ncbi:MAG: Glu-tRNA(Gln) amidotransferase subunit GatD, partial [Nitrososphaerota archaeon]